MRRLNRPQLRKKDSTMKKIKLFEDAIRNKCGNLKEAGINGTMFWAYRNSKEAGNELIDFNEVIWDYDVEEIVKTCRENGVEQFTISSTFSGLIRTLAEFEKHDCKVGGLTQVNARYTDIFTGEREIIPALIMNL